MLAIVALANRLVLFLRHVKCYSQDTQAENTINVLLQGLVDILALHHNEWTCHQQDVQRESDEAERKAHIQLSSKWQALSLDVGIEHLPRVADRRTLKDDVEREDRGDENVHRDRAPEHPDQDTILGPLHHGDGNASLHYTRETYIDDLEEPNILGFTVSIATRRVCNSRWRSYFQNIRNLWQLGLERMATNPVHCSENEKGSETQICNLYHGEI